MSLSRAGILRVGVAPKAKGKGILSNFARALLVPNERMQMSSRRTLEVSSLSSILMIMQA